MIVPISPQSKYAFRLTNGQFVNGKMVYDIEIVKVKP